MCEKKYVKRTKRLRDNRRLTQRETFINPVGRLLYIMLALFRAFLSGKSIEHYSSILVAFYQIFFSLETKKK